MYGSKPKDFQFAIEEAFLAESGYSEMGHGTEQEAPAADHIEIQEATGSNEDQEFYTHNKASCSSLFYLHFFQHFFDANNMSTLIKFFLAFFWSQASQID